MVRSGLNFFGSNWSDPVFRPANFLSLKTGPDRIYIIKFFFFKVYIHFLFWTNPKLSSHSHAARRSSTLLSLSLPLSLYTNMSHHPLTQATVHRTTTMTSSSPSLQPVEASNPLSLVFSLFSLVFSHLSLYPKSLYVYWYTYIYMSFSLQIRVN